MCNTVFRIVIRAIAASISAFASLETLLENKLSKHDGYQITKYVTLMQKVQHHKLFC